MLFIDSLENTSQKKKIFAVLPPRMIITGILMHFHWVFFPCVCVCVCVCVCARARVCIGRLSIHIYTRHMYLKSLSPSVHCRRTKSVLPMKMHIRCYINKNYMIFNVISLFHIINHFLKDFCIGHIISKSSSILILKAPHFF